MTERAEKEPTTTDVSFGWADTPKPLPWEPPPCDEERHLDTLNELSALPTEGTFGAWLDRHGHR